ncbi:MAG: hypothetical protein CFE23_15545 [Flavobacterium sp. BFFFF1]|uniref:hypothetical protein n=1 Tax=Flavobacterium sp. BFFFF1 TaxID=2015557 RepID=UPI000BDB76BE|nr:hypothetical protein [Flavobacterium sp. BFFFF1]OYU79117.1 MAG: hypothetical protein CFE23_15545 [Flavobacterium sp. BFFFF1]
MHNSFEELCIAHKSECESNDCGVRSKVAVEKGKRFEIVSNEDFIKLRIDDCLVKSQQVKKCDFGFVRNSNKEFYFVELKGSDIDTAYEQIINTIDIFQRELIQIPKPQRYGFIVSSKVPKSGTDVNNLKQDFAKNRGNKLEIKNRDLRHSPK